MPMTMPGALAHEHKHVEAATRAASVKSHDQLGERLEGDVYYFRPRHVLGRSGITFNASLDFIPKLPGCTPILDRTVLRAGAVARDFLFDLPTRPGNDLTLIYQPTRWGGAG